MRGKVIQNGDHCICIRTRNVTIDIDMLHLLLLLVLFLCLSRSTQYSMDMQEKHGFGAIRSSATTRDTVVLQKKRRRGIAQLENIVAVEVYTVAATPVHHPAWRCATCALTPADRCNQTWGLRRTHQRSQPCP